ncbi:hypothetical protein crov412 [Cafeteria roenbergensis virus]|uniref:Restriction endonuclease type IV Mrr domain-containing protein n=1 Tax=Cafeteria roenbergensis virus (strain BV-PW1) TaxID=693272 RepID=E3T5I3_CROVB|nr:hypothetical protein crov412 [Cafeteria roenbergensis virus BV-PW1]ADO67446.1 hypothetical protein crov412 [Cafeteria roenbergensis virus BV-PW1]
MFQFNINLQKYPELNNIKKAVLKDKIQEIFNTGYKLLYPNLNEINPENNLIISKLDKLEKNTPNIFELNKSITQLLGITTNSSRKGELVEGILEEYIKLKYSSNSYQVKRSQAHCGDGWLTLPNKKKVIVEVKAYSKTVSEQEVDKLKYDMKYSNINLGIIISLGSKIQNSRMVDLEMFTHLNKPYYIVKLGPVGNNQELLEIAFNLIENLSNIINNNTRQIIIEDNLLQKTSLLMEKINFNQQLRQNYQSLSLEIYQKMECFGQEMLKLFIEQDNLIREIITEINENSINEIILNSNQNDELEKYTKHKIYPNLLKLIDFINTKNISWNLNKDKIISKNIEIKIAQDKLTINLVNLKITLILTSKSSDIKSNKANLKLLEQLLN